MTKHFAFCGRCHNLTGQTRPISRPGGVTGTEITIEGCKKMSKEKWDEGWRHDDDGHLHQHNCPLMLLLRVEDERRCV